MLTVIGYSVMDTIVILDRIRENTKVMVGEPYDKIVNTSILQTMTRSVNTLATVVITLVALLAFGGASLQELRLRAARRHLLGRLPLDLLLGAARASRSASANSKRARASALSRSDRSRAAAGRTAAMRAPARASRDDIVAARRARREQQKTSGSRSANARPHAIAASAKRTRRASVDTMDPVDPLDAQDERVCTTQPSTLGHEEITLNLEGFAAPAPEHEPDATHQA